MVTIESDGSASEKHSVDGNVEDPSLQQQYGSHGSQVATPGSGVKRSTKRSTNQLEFLRKFVAELFKTKPAFFFRKPVDVDALAIPVSIHLHIDFRLLIFES